MARRHHRRFVRSVDRLEVGSLREAVAVIVAGRVTVNGVIVTNPDSLIAADAVVALATERVVRGTVRLQAALSDSERGCRGGSVLIWVPPLAGSPL